MQLANALLREDKTQEAVAEVEALFAAVKPIPGALEREWRFHWGRAMAYLRLAEIENCINRHNDECCVFPLKGGGVHSDKSPATEAAKSFLDYLEIKPDDLNARWLLNIASMAAGNAERAFPRSSGSPRSARTAPPSSRAFATSPTQCGITQRNFAGGVIADDMDGDGLDDLVLSSSAPDARLSYFRGKPDGTFEERAAAAGIDCQLGGLDLLANDYDNDGDLDILVLRGAWMFDLGRVRMSLLRNDGRGNVHRRDARGRPRRARVSDPGRRLVRLRQRRRPRPLRRPRVAHGSPSAIRSRRTISPRASTATTATARSRTSRSRRAS